MDIVQSFDYSVLSFIQEQLRGPVLNPILQFITHLGDAGFIWIVIAVLCLIRRSTRRCGVTMLIALLLGLLIGNVLLKNLIARPRPFITYEELVPLISQSGWSFPSGHSLSSFTAATAVFYHHKKAGILCYLLAAAIAFSRLYVGVHYPSDVVCGALIGIIIGILSGFAVSRLGDRLHYRKIRPKEK